MNRKFLLISRAVEHKLYQYTRPELRLWMNKYALKLSLFAIATFIILQKDLSIHLDLSAANTSEIFAHTAVMPTSLSNQSAVAKTVAIKTPTPESSPTIWSKIKNNLFSSSEKTDDNLANTYSNMSFRIGDYAKKKKMSPQRAAKRKKQLAYVKHFADVAQKEMEKYGIPASITLAQGLIESNCGESRLATKNNNHFGIKCFSRSCKKGHCSNFTDDSHKDFFRKYKSSWDSFRAHSKLLKNKRYRRLFQLKKADYKGWAMGLKKAGYATDKLYGEKLIDLIEDLELYKYD